MIYLVGNAPDSSRYVQRDFADFLPWVRQRKLYQLDIETTVTPHWCTKKIITVQFGNASGSERWVLQWSALSAEQKFLLKQELESPVALKLIHNAAFEAIVFRFHDIRITNVYDTMLMEMVLNSGNMLNDEDTENEESEAAAGFFALRSLCQRYLCYNMDKTEQTNFGDDILTESKVVYAADDVKPLGAIRSMQLLELHAKDLEYVAALENEVVLAYAEITYNGMELDQAKWLTNEELAYPVIAEAKHKLDTWLLDPVFQPKAIELGYLSMEDRLTVNWKSPVQLKEIVAHFFPFLEGKTSKATLEKLLRDHAKTGAVFSDERVLPYVQAIANKEWKLIEDTIVEIDRQWLIEHEYLLPGGEPTINWNSRDQALAILRQVHKGLPDLSADTMAKFTHPIGEALTDYKDSLKLVTTYGEAFIQKYVEPDGKVRTQFTQVVSTGRVSSKKPNMQNIPAKESVGTRYRNAFVCAPEWVYVDSDYASQELVIIYHISQDPVWGAALKNGEDLHSVCAELVFRDGWPKAGDPDCAYYKLVDGKPAHQKCKCKGHKHMRNAVKSINFGLAYGMSEFKLSATLSIDLKAAKALIADYFRAFPRIGTALTYLGRFGVQNGYIQTIAPFFRKRWFPYWKFSRRNIKDHLSKVQYDPTLGSIERASKNQPIQGTAADIAKLSLLMLYWEIHTPAWEGLVKLVQQVHDQNTTQVLKTKAEPWRIRMDEIMREAALFVIPSGLLGCETTISPVWTK